MGNYDQAEGLRRMLFGAKPRFVTFLSALEHDDRVSTLVNLSAGLARQGNDVVLLDARSTGLCTMAWMDLPVYVTLLDVAREQGAIKDAIVSTSHGFGLASIARYQCIMADMVPSVSGELAYRLDKVVDIVGKRSDVVLVDGELDQYDGLATPALEQGEIVIQVTNHPDSIKLAYSLIKRAHGKFGRRSYGVLVTGVNDAQARRVFATMAQVAGSFLSVPLNFVGYVPDDVYLQRASRSGRSVFDAFPLAGASVAFARLAQQLTGFDDFAAARA